MWQVHVGSECTTCSIDHTLIHWHSVEFQGCPHVQNYYRFHFFHSILQSRNFLSQYILAPPYIMDMKILWNIYFPTANVKNKRTQSSIKFQPDLDFQRQKNELNFIWCNYRKARCNTRFMFLHNSNTRRLHNSSNYETPSPWRHKSINSGTVLDSTHLTQHFNNKS